MGYLIYNFFLAIFLILWSILWICVAIVVRVVTLNPEWSLSLGRIAYSPALIRAARAQLRIEPLPDIDWKKPHIFVMNHQSMLDIACAFVALPVNLRFVAKHTLKYVPFLGWYMWATGMVFVNRSKRVSAVNSLASAVKQIQNGANIIAFPEGTRSRDGSILPFKKGVFVLALESQVPIVPIAIEGSGKVAPSDGFRVRPGLVRMKIGQPIDTKNRSIHERHQLIEEVREAMLQLHRDIGGMGKLDDSSPVPPPLSAQRLPLT